MNIENTIDYWLNVENFEEAKAKVMTGDMDESTKQHIEILKELDIKKTDLVLDFGCGIGRLTKPIAEQCRQIIGADISEKMIGYASKYCTNENTMFQPLNNEEGDGLTPNIFDKVFSIIVLQHMDKLKAFRALTNMVKALRIGGKMLIQFPDLDRNKTMYQNYTMFKPDFGALQPRMEFYTKRELEYLFDLFKMNYTIIEGKTDHYVIAIKLEDIDIKKYYAQVTTWKN